jgi:hypothetical protein
MDARFRGHNADPPYPERAAFDIRFSIMRANEKRAFATDPSGSNQK